MNKNTKRRMKLVRYDAKKSGQSIPFLLKEHGSMVEDSRPSRNGTHSFRYKGI